MSDNKSADQSANESDSESEIERLVLSESESNSDHDSDRGSPIIVDKLKKGKKTIFRYCLLNRVNRFYLIIKTLFNFIFESTIIKLW